MSSLFATMALDSITLDDAMKLLQLPRSLGDDPADGSEIVANNGRYGPYVVKEKDFRSIDSEEQLLTITLEQAAKIFSEPKVFKRGGRNMAAKGPLREFGTDPHSERPVVAKDGRFGVYVTDGETNASIGKGDRIEEITPERAYELLAIRRDVVAAKGGAKKKADQEEGRREEAGARRSRRRRLRPRRPPPRRALPASRAATRATRSERCVTLPMTLR